MIAFERVEAAAQVRYFARREGGEEESARIMALGVLVGVLYVDCSVSALFFFVGCRARVMRRGIRAWVAR